jgi:acetyl esterase/lipase
MLDTGRRNAIRSLSVGVLLAVPSIDEHRAGGDVVVQRRAARSANVTVVRDVSYGTDRKQRFDVYAPKGVRNAPVILMVHGGAWRIGDKRSRGVVENKVARWSRFL